MRGGLGARPGSAAQWDRRCHRLTGNNRSQRRIARRRYAVGTAIGLLFDPAFRQHSRNNLLPSWVHLFWPNASGEAHLL
jgi:hypothetical protein